MAEGRAAAPPEIVYLVDDDPSVRDALGLLLSLRGYATASFASAEDFLGAVGPQARGCVVADIRMPGMTGLEMQEALAQRHAALPVIVITGHGDIAAARRAFKANAVDFLEKPFEDAALLGAIEAALAARPVDPAPALAQLSPREREVLARVVDGLDNRSVGEQLGISPRTVEVHKARLMAKLGARNLTDLIRRFGPRR